jgi:hypothetical protein
MNGRPVSVKTSKTKMKKHMSVNSLADETGLDWRTVKRRLRAAGLIPLKGRSRATLLAALKNKLPNGTPSPLKERKTFEEWRKLKIRNDREEAGLISREAVKATVKALVPKFHELLDRKLLNEYPAAVAGLDVPGARIYGKKLNDEIRAEIQSWAHLWP